MFTFFTVFLGVLLLQALLQFFCVRLDARKFPPPGTIVKIPRGHMHVCQMGSGGPAIVLEAGIAASSLSWSILQPLLAEFTSTYSYDRAGFGWSPSFRKECTLHCMTEDLHDLVTTLSAFPGLMFWWDTRTPLTLSALTRSAFPANWPECFCWIRLHPKNGSSRGMHNAGSFAERYGSLGRAQCLDR